MTEKKREIPWFWYLLAIGFLYLLASRFEPLKTINEMYPFPNTFSAHVLVVFILIITATVGFTLAFRKGRAIRKEKRCVCARRASATLNLYDSTIVMMMWVKHYGSEIVLALWQNLNDFSYSSATLVYRT